MSRGSTDVVLTDEDIELIERIQSSQYPDKSHDPYTVSCYIACIVSNLSECYLSIL